MHQDTGNPGEPGQVPDQLAVWKEGGIGPVVGHQPRQSQPQFRVVVARVVSRTGEGADVGVLPGAPLGIDEAALPGG